MVYYLDPEFDPKKLTKAELRSIMASHGILNLPAPSAKKEELLLLFNEEILAKRKSILESQKNIKAKSDGIVFLDESSRPSPKKPKKLKAKLIDSVNDDEISPSSKEINENLITRPETPLNISTYKLVSRLENLQENKGSKRKQIINNQRNLFFKSIGALLSLTLIIIYIYFKFWFVWPTYTNDQLKTLARKPIFSLRCPYPNNSLIGSCSDGKLYCSSGYIEKRNCLGFGSSCIIDKERMSLIQSIKKKIVFELQTRLGMNYCYNLLSPVISRKELHDTVFNYFKSMKSKTFSEYFDICLRSLLQEGAKIEAVKRNDAHSEEIFYKAQEPIFTYYCQVKISIRNILDERPIEVISGIFLAFVTTILIFQYNLKRVQRISVQNYYLLICKILKEQSAQHRCDPSVPSFISTNQLRDAVLIKCSTREKTLLWPKIMNEVSKNSNIVESITIFRGEQTRVWEWIGADVSL